MTSHQWVFIVPMGATRPLLAQEAWSFHESFDHDVLAPVYQESVIYDARSRHIRVHTPTIEVGRDKTLIVALRDLPAMNNQLPLDMDSVNAIHFMSSAESPFGFRLRSRE